MFKISCNFSNNFVSRVVSKFFTMCKIFFLQFLKISAITFWGENWHISHLRFMKQLLFARRIITFLTPHDLSLMLVSGGICCCAEERFALPHPDCGRVPLGGCRGVLLGQDLQSGRILHLHLPVVEVQSHFSTLQRYHASGKTLKLFCLLFVKIHWFNNTIMGGILFSFELPKVSDLWRAFWADTGPLLCQRTKK